MDGQWISFQGHEGFIQLKYLPKPLCTWRSSLHLFFGWSRRFSLRHTNTSNKNDRISYDNVIWTRHAVLCSSSWGPFSYLVAMWPILFHYRRRSSGTATSVARNSQLNISWRSTDDFTLVSLYLQLWLQHGYYLKSSLPLFNLIILFLPRNAWIQKLLVKFGTWQNIFSCRVIASDSRLSIRSCDITPF